MYNYITRKFIKVIFQLGGVIEPHDGMCYLNEKGDYTHSLVFDYPSVSQVQAK